jgi:hypothetical protein
MVSNPPDASYGASKAAAWSLTNGIRTELAHQATLVVAIHASFIDPAPYRGDLGQLLVVGLAQHPLLEHIELLVQLEGERGELGVKRADQWMQRPDRVASKLGMDRTCLVQGIEGRARRATQRDQESGGVVAVHFDGLAELLIEAEADEHDPVPVNLQLRALAKLS